LAALTAALLLSTTAHSPCRAALPQGPPVPAAIVFKTSCGGYLLATTGHVTRLPRHWFASHSGGTGRRFGADLQIRRNRTGRITLLRHGRLAWRSRDLYPNTAADVAFGPHAFAFPPSTAASSSPTCAGRKGSSFPAVAATRTTSSAAAA